MKRLRAGLMDLFIKFTYLCYLDLMFWVCLLSGLVVFGLGASGAVLIQALADFRHKGRQYSFKEYWHAYRLGFKRYTLAGVAMVAGGALSLLNLRIIAVYFTSRWLVPVYLFFILLVAMLASLAFMTAAKDRVPGLMNHLRVGVVLAFRFPLLAFALVFCWAALFMVLAQRLGLLLFFGPVVFAWFGEWLHNQMITKTKALQARWEDDVQEEH